MDRPPLAPVVSRPAGMVTTIQQSGSPSRAPAPTNKKRPKVNDNEASRAEPVDPFIPLDEDIDHSPHVAVKHGQSDLGDMERRRHRLRSDLRVPQRRPERPEDAEFYIKREKAGVSTIGRGPPNQRVPAAVGSFDHLPGMRIQRQMEALMHQHQTVDVMTLADDTNGVMEGEIHGPGRVQELLGAARLAVSDTPKPSSWYTAEDPLKGQMKHANSMRVPNASQLRRKPGTQKTVSLQPKYDRQVRRDRQVDLRLDAGDAGIPELADVDAAFSTPKRSREVRDGEEGGWWMGASEMHAQTPPPRHDPVVVTVDERGYSTPPPRAVDPDALDGEVRAGRAPGAVARPVWGQQRVSSLAKRLNDSPGAMADVALDVARQKALAAVRRIPLVITKDPNTDVAVAARSRLFDAPLDRPGRDVDVNDEEGGVASGEEKARRSPQRARNSFLASDTKKRKRRERPHPAEGKQTQDTILAVRHDFAPDGLPDPEETLQQFVESSMRSHERLYETAHGRQDGARRGVGIRRSMRSGMKALDDDGDVSSASASEGEGNPSARSRRDPTTSGNVARDSDDLFSGPALHRQSKKPILFEIAVPPTGEVEGSGHRTILNEHELAQRGFDCDQYRLLRSSYANTYGKARDQVSSLLDGMKTALERVAADVRHEAAKKRMEEREAALQQSLALRAQAEADGSSSIVDRKIVRPVVKPDTTAIPFQLHDKTDEGMKERAVERFNRKANRNPIQNFPAERARSESERKAARRKLREERRRRGEYVERSTVSGGSLATAGLASATSPFLQAASAPVSSEESAEESSNDDTTRKEEGAADAGEHKPPLAEVRSASPLVPAVFSKDAESIVWDRIDHEEDEALGFGAAASGSSATTVSAGSRELTPRSAKRGPPLTVEVPANRSLGSTIAIDGDTPIVDFSLGRTPQHALFATARSTDSGDSNSGDLKTESSSNLPSPAPRRSTLAVVPSIPLPHTTTTPHDESDSTPSQDAVTTKSDSQSQLASKSGNQTRSNRELSNSKATPKATRSPSNRTPQGKKPNASPFAKALQGMSAQNTPSSMVLMVTPKGKEKEKSLSAESEEEGTPIHSEEERFGAPAVVSKSPSRRAGQDRKPGIPKKTPRKTPSNAALSPDAQRSPGGRSPSFNALTPRTESPRKSASSSKLTAGGAQTPRRTQSLSPRQRNDSSRMSSQQATPRSRSMSPRKANSRRESPGRSPSNLSTNNRKRHELQRIASAKFVVEIGSSSDDEDRRSARKEPSRKAARSQDSRSQDSRKSPAEFTFGDDSGNSRLSRPRDSFSFDSAVNSRRSSVAVGSLRAPSPEQRRPSFFADEIVIPKRERRASSAGGARRKSIGLAYAGDLSSATGAAYQKPYNFCGRKDLLTASELLQLYSSPYGTPWDDPALCYDDIIHEIKAPTNGPTSPMLRHRGSLRRGSSIRIPRSSIKTGEDESLPDRHQDVLQSLYNPHRDDPAAIRLPPIARKISEEYCHSTAVVITIDYVDNKRLQSLDSFLSMPVAVGEWNHAGQQSGGNLDSSTLGSPNSDQFGQPQLSSGPGSPSFGPVVPVTEGESKMLTSSFSVDVNPITGSARRAGLSGSTKNPAEEPRVRRGFPNVDRVDGRSTAQALRQQGFYVYELQSRRDAMKGASAFHGPDEMTPTRAAIISTIKRALANTKRGGLCLVYIIGRGGHGVLPGYTPTDQGKAWNRQSYVNRERGKGYEVPSNACHFVFAEDSDHGHVDASSVIILEELAKLRPPRDPRIRRTNSEKRAREEMASKGIGSIPDDPDDYVIAPMVIADVKALRVAPGGLKQQSWTSYAYMNYPGVKFGGNFNAFYEKPKDDKERQSKAKKHAKLIVNEARCNLMTFFFLRALTTMRLQSSHALTNEENREAVTVNALNHLAYEWLTEPTRLERGWIGTDSMSYARVHRQQLLFHQFAPESNLSFFDDPMARAVKPVFKIHDYVDHLDNRDDAVHDEDTAIHCMLHVTVDVGYDRSGASRALLINNLTEHIRGMLKNLRKDEGKESDALLALVERDEEITRVENAQNLRDGLTDEGALTRTKSGVALRERRRMRQERIRAGNLLPTIEAVTGTGVFVAAMDPEIFANYTTKEDAFQEDFRKLCGVQFGGKMELKVETSAASFASQSPLNSPKTSKQSSPRIAKKGAQSMANLSPPARHVSSKSPMASPRTPLTPSSPSLSGTVRNLNSSASAFANASPQSDGLGDSTPAPHSLMSTVSLATISQTMDPEKQGGPDLKLMWEAAKQNPPLYGINPRINYDIMTTFLPSEACVVIDTRFHSRTAQILQVLHRDYGDIIKRYLQFLPKEDTVERNHTDDVQHARAELASNYYEKGKNRLRGKSSNMFGMQELVSVDVRVHSTGVFYKLSKMLHLNALSAKGIQGESYRFVSAELLPSSATLRRKVVIIQSLIRMHLSRRRTVPLLRLYHEFLQRGLDMLEDNLRFLYGEEGLSTVTELELEPRQWVAPVPTAYQIEAAKLHGAALPVYREKAPFVMTLIRDPTLRSASAFFSDLGLPPPVSVDVSLPDMDNSNSLSASMVAPGLLGAPSMAINDNDQIAATGLRGLMKSEFVGSVRREERSIRKEMLQEERESFLWIVKRFMKVIDQECVQQKYCIEIEWELGFTEATEAFVRLLRVLSVFGWFYKLSKAQAKLDRDEIMKRLRLQANENSERSALHQMKLMNRPRR